MQVNRKLLKGLLWAFGISISLNVILIAFGIYEWQERGVSLLALAEYHPQEIPPELLQSSPLLEQELGRLCQSTFSELLCLLSDTSQSFGVYKNRDLALGVLTSLHYFNIEKALQGYRPKHTQELTISSKKVTLYPGLIDEHHHLILDYAREEKWPFTSEGLFMRLREQKGCFQDPSLQAAFVQTDEYHRLSSLLARDADIKEEQILSLILEADWPLIAQASKPRQLTLEECREVKRCFLMRLAKTYPDLAGHALAAKKAVEQKVEQRVEQEVRPPPKKVGSEIMYTVQYGDSLWSISRKFHVDIETIKKINQLQTDVLKPGCTLRIPSQ